MTMSDCDKFRNTPQTVDGATAHRLAALCVNKSPSPKTIVFLAALEKLCVDHKVTLSTSGYDGLQVWDLNAMSGPISCAGIEDCTAQTK